MKKLFVILSCLSGLSFAYESGNYKILQEDIFRPQNKKIVLFGGTSHQKKIILFQTTLRVNTDGLPLSYHPQDLYGKDKALNSICNAIAVRKGKYKNNLCNSEDRESRREHLREAISTFEKFRDFHYQAFPEGYRITSENVFATKRENGKDIRVVHQ